MSIHVDGPMPGDWRFYKSLQGGYFLQGAAGNASSSFEIILATEEIHQADANVIETVPKLLAALEEIKRNCDPWQKADNMAGRLYKIADSAIRQAMTKRPITFYQEG